MIHKKLVILFVAIWILIFCCLWLANFFIMRYPIGTSLAADYCLIPPTLRQAKLAAEYVQFSKLFDVFGEPQYCHDDVSTVSFSYDLQLGYIVRFTAWGEDLTITQISPPFTSTRWLIFPSIMILVAGIEVVIYRLVVRRKGMLTNK